MDSNKNKNNIMDLAIILLNYNGSEDTIECIKSLDHQISKRSFDIYILDNGSRLEEFRMLKSYIGTRADYSILNYSPALHLESHQNYLIRSEENFGFAKGNNNVTRLVLEQYSFVVLLNNDTIVENCFVDDMLSYLDVNDKLKFASCRINNYYDRNLLWSCGGKLLWWGNKHSFTESELAKFGESVATSYISGCALFLKTDMLKKDGLLTEDFFHGEEDFNFCWRMMLLGNPGGCLNKTLVYHKVSVSSKKTGIAIGKIAGYYVNRIIDMHKFFHPVKWEIWRRLLMIFVAMDCKRKKVSNKEIREILKTINKYSHNTQLTYKDCIEMGRF